jgi:radical SAM superfamily enzyme YgiQ (UPF0313 family)
MPNTSVLLTSYNICGNFSLALGYLKAYALKNSSLEQAVDIEIIDFCVTCNDNIQALYYFAKRKPDVIGFSCYCWNADKVADLVRVTRQVLPQAKLVLGGPEVGPAAEKYLRENPAVDIVVRGEGEVTFSELIQHYATGGGKLEDIQGISYRKDGEIFSNEDRPLIENLDDIPSPYLTSVLTSKDSVTYVETYRGCPFKCAYCYEGKDYSRLRHFSENRIREEIQHIMRNDSVKSFSFVDPVFNLDGEHLQKLSAIISESNLYGTKLHTIEIASELVEESTVSALKKASVYSIETGPQTVNTETLKNIKRYFNLEKFQQGVRMILENDIRVICDLMVGLPGDNFFRFAKSVDFVFSLRPSAIIFSTLHVLPGTHLYKNAADFSIEFEDKPPHNVIANNTFSFEEIKKAEIMAKSLQKEYNLGF